MENVKTVQIFFDGVTCFVDIENRAIYSARGKKMKPQHLPQHIDDYYLIKFNGNKKYKSISQLIEMALLAKDHEKL